MKNLRTSLRHACPLALLALSASLPAQTAPATLTVDTATITHPVSPMLYGLMTEEINHSYDGGLYAQLINNPTFHKHWDGAEGWGLVRHGDASATAALDQETGPSKALPSSLKLTVTSASVGNEAGVSNAGYWGIPLHAHTRYHGSLYAKTDLTFILPLRVQLNWTT